MEQEQYEIEIEGWKQSCNESSYEEMKPSLNEYYNQNRLINTIKDKYIRIFSGVCFAALLILAVVAVHYNKVLLVIGILLGLLGGFLLWRRVADMALILKAKRDKGQQLLKNTLIELGEWRKAYQAADEKHSDLMDVFSELM